MDAAEIIKKLTRLSKVDRPAVVRELESLRLEFDSHLQQTAPSGYFTNPDHQAIASNIRERARVVEERLSELGKEIEALIQRLGPPVLEMIARYKAAAEKIRRGSNGKPPGTPPTPGQHWLSANPRPAGLRMMSVRRDEKHPGVMVSVPRPGQNPAEVITDYARLLELTEQAEAFVTETNRGKPTRQALAKFDRLEGVECR